MYIKKLIILFAIIILSVFQIKAQDKLITQKGDVKTAYNVEVGSTNIFYKLENKDGAPLQQILKKDVVMIIHQDGSKVLLDKGDVTSNTLSVNNMNNVSHQADMVAADSLTTELAKKSNEKLLAYYNKELVSFNNEKIKAKNKDADYSLYVFGCRKNSVISDANVDVDYYFKQIEKREWSGGKVLPPNAILSAAIHNKTDKIIYIDLGNTFINSSVTDPRPYYTPTSTAQTSGRESGGSVNLGGITSTLGVGGVVGMVANGANVGGSKSSSSTTVTYSQRIIAIPPHATKQLEDQTFYAICRSTKIKIGEVQSYNDVDSLENMNNSYISYSFNENGSNLNHLEAHFYVREIIGIRCKSKFDDSLFSMKTYKFLVPHFEDLSSNYEKTIHLVGPF